MLAMLYPEKSLLVSLAAPGTSTPAQQSYLEILVKVRTSNVGLILSLARSYLAAALPDKAQSALEQLKGKLSPLDTKKVLELTYEVRRQQLKFLHTGDKRWPTAQRQYSNQVDTLLRAGATPVELGRYQADALSAGDMATAQRLESLLHKKQSNISTAAVTKQNSGAKTAQDALAQGNYRAAAMINFQNMQKASHNEKRMFFLAAVRVLQSGNLLNEALSEAEIHLNGLANDRETLIYLSRLALASNRPQLAQRYIRRALGIAESAEGGA
jgi:hypothetical protein